MGSTYKGGSPTHRSLRENLPRVAENPLFVKNGNHYGDARTNGAAVTTIESDNPIKVAQEFFDRIGYGGMFMTDAETAQITENRVRLRDGTIINFRVTSKSGWPAVEINVKKSSDSCGIRSHKIHFIYRRH